MAVDLILSDLSHGLAVADYLADFPHLTREDIEAVLSLPHGGAGREAD